MIDTVWKFRRILPVVFGKMSAFACVFVYVTDRKFLNILSLILNQFLNILNQFYLY